ncbi:MAG: DMT family transporter [Burkholderiaceae bacterium]
MKSRYFLQLVALSAVWGTGYLLTRIATPALGPSVTAASRLGFGAATLALIMYFNHAPWPWKYWRELLVLGAFGIAMPHFLYSWSSLYLPAGYSAVVSVTSVLFGTFASAWMKEDTLTFAKIFGCIAAFIGVALVVQPGPLQSNVQVLQGTALGIGGAAMSGATAPLLKRATTRMEPLAITAVIHLFGCLLLAPAALWNLPKAHFTLGAVAAVAVMGICTSGLAYWQYMRIVRHVTPVAALSSTFMVTIFGVLWGHLVLDEVFTLASYAGAALVLVATVLVTGFNPLRRTAAAAVPKP